MLSFIAERAKEDATALVRPGGEQMSFATLGMAAAAVMQAVEARAGEVAHRVVGVAVDDAAGFVASVLAVLEAGGVVLPLDPARSPDSLQAEAEAARAVAVIVGDAAEDRLEVVAGDASRRELAPEACLLLAAAHGRRALHSRQALGIGVDAVAAQLGLDASARVPLLGAAHELLLAAVLPTLRAGGALLGLGGMRVVDQAAAMARLGATHLTGAAALVGDIAAAVMSSQISAARSAGAQLKRVTVLGALAADESTLLRRAFPGVRVERARDTPETLRIAAGEREPLTPLAGVRIEGDLVHAPTLMMGYLDDAEATAAAFVEREGERWLRMV